MNPEKQYYYAEGDNAIGPFSLEKLRKLLESGLISRQTQVAPEETDDWKALGDIVGPEAAAEAPEITYKSDNTANAGHVGSIKASVVNPGRSNQLKQRLSQFWSLVSRWPYAFLFAGAIFLLVGYFQAGQLGGPLSWGLIAFEAFLRLLAMLICFAAIKAIKNARKAKEITGIKNFCVSLLTALLYIEAGFNGIMFPVRAYTAYNAYQVDSYYSEVAPGEFRESIRNQSAMPGIGEDALVLRSIIQASHPNMSFERTLQLLGELQHASMTPLTEEYYYMRLGITEMLQRNRPDIDVNADPRVLMGMVAQLEEQDAWIRNEYSQMEAQIAAFYDFRNWNELREYVFNYYGADLPQTTSIQEEARTALPTY